MPTAPADANADAAATESSQVAGPVATPVATATVVPESPKIVELTVPPGLVSGSVMEVDVGGQMLKVAVPQGAVSGSKFQFQVPVPTPSKPAVRIVAATSRA